MRLTATEADIVIVGGGPAGLAASFAATEAGRKCTLIDDNPSLGGQIWRGERLGAAGHVLSGARVIAGNPAARTLLVETDQDSFSFGYKKLILATGSRELFLPFPGWTLPNVMGAGGLQSLVKAGLPIKGATIVVAGTGPLLFAVTAYLRRHRAFVPLIAEQVPFRKQVAFGAGMLRHPAKIFEALRFKARSFGVPYRTGTWVEAAEGNGKVERVRLRSGKRTWTQTCDYLATGYGLIPNGELPAALGCKLQGNAVVVDEFQRTSVPDILCAGEATGIGGLDLSCAEGTIAGLVAAGQEQEAHRGFIARYQHGRWALAIESAFALRPELKQLSEPDTILCRCEDVTYNRMQSMPGWRAAKLYTRCGMGPCQGRICGAASEFLFGWKCDSVRPPVFPARLESLCSPVKGPIL